MLESLRVFLYEHIFSNFSGLTLGSWCRLLLRERFRVALRYVPRALFITFLSLLNSIQARRELHKYSKNWRARRPIAPLFILGHWRSGTTHLHNLLSLDPAHVSPTLYEVLHPSTFLMNGWQANALRGLLPKDRQVDAMKVGFDLPAEDEFALATETGLSPYLGWAFPQSQEHYERYLNFRTATPKERAIFQEFLLEFFSKLAWKHQGRLILKSPPHTARIRLILEVFPDARFLLIHRDPFAVFPSTCKLITKGTLGLRLQKMDNSSVAESVLRQYETMFEAYFEERTLIPPGQLFEVGFQALEDSPTECLSKAYHSLGLGPVEPLIPKWRDHLATLANFRKNDFPPLNPEQRQLIVTRWKRTFDEWNYPVD